MEHGKVDYVNFVGTPQQKLVMGRGDIVSLAANLEEYASIRWSGRHYNVAHDHEVLLVLPPVVS